MSNQPPNDQPSPAEPKQMTFMPEAPEKTTLLGLAKWDRNDQGRYWLKFLWKRVLVTFAVLGLVGWLGLSTAAWAFVTYNRKVENVSIFDIALPFRWKEYQRKRGNSYVEQAKVAMKEARFREAFQMLRIGVAKSPANLEGRRELARIYQAIGRPDLGMTLIEDGFDYAENDPDYLIAYVQLLLANQEDDRTRELAAKRLPQTSPGSRSAQILALGAANANFFRGDYDAAEDFLAMYGLERTGEGRLLEAQIEWDRGYHEIALLRLRSLINEQPTNEEPYAVLFQYLGELGRTSQATSLAVERAVAFPDSVAAQGALLYGYAGSGNDIRLAREIDRLAARIPSDPRTFFVLAEFAINTGDVALADRLRDIAAESDVGPGTATIVAIEARVMAREYANALERFATLNEEKPEWLQTYGTSLAALQAVAEFGTGDTRTGDLMLAQFLGQANPRAESLLALSNQLRKTGAAGAARRVLAHAVSIDKKNQAALASLIELDLEDGRLEDLASNTVHLLSMRKPSVDLLERVYHALGTDRLLFSQERTETLPLIAETIAKRRQQTNR